MFKVKEFEKDDIDGVIAFERVLREQEPNTYYWEPDVTCRKQLEQSFEDERFRNALSFIATKDHKVIGRIDASLISSRSDASCFSAYMDWICVLKSERHHNVAQALLNALREKPCELSDVSSHSWRNHRPCCCASCSISWGSRSKISSRLALMSEFWKKFYIIFFIMVNYV